MLPPINYERHDPVYIQCDDGLARAGTGRVRRAVITETMKQHDCLYAVSSKA